MINMYCGGSHSWYLFIVCLTGAFWAFRICKCIFGESHGSSIGAIRGMSLFRILCSSFDSVLWHTSSVFCCCSPYFVFRVCISHQHLLFFSLSALIFLTFSIYLFFISLFLCLSANLVSSFSVAIFAIVCVLLSSLLCI
jgi:hypothetical protein